MVQFIVVFSEALLHLYCQAQVITLYSPYHPTTTTTTPTTPPPTTTTTTTVEVYQVLNKYTGRAPHNYITVQGHVSCAMCMTHNSSLRTILIYHSSRHSNSSSVVFIMKWL